MVCELNITIMKFSIMEKKLLFVWNKNSRILITWHLGFLIIHSTTGFLILRNRKVLYTLKYFEPYPKNYSTHYYENYIYY